MTAKFTENFGTTKRTLLNRINDLTSLVLWTLLQQYFWMLTNVPWLCKIGAVWEYVFPVSCFINLKILTCYPKTKGRLWYVYMHICRNFWNVRWEVADSFFPWEVWLGGRIENDGRVLKSGISFYFIPFSPIWLFKSTFIL